MAIYLKKRRTVIEEWKLVDTTETTQSDVKFPVPPFEQLNYLRYDLDLKPALSPPIEIEGPAGREGETDD